MAEETPRELAGVLSVDLDGQWVGLEVSRLAVVDGLLVSTGIDAQVNVTLPTPLRYVGLEVELEGPYAGDRFCLYYAQGNGAPITEDTSLIFELERGPVATILSFDESIERVRIDPIERTGETNIKALRIVAAKEERHARELLSRGSAKGPEQFTLEQVVVDPDRRDAFSAWSPSSVKAEIRARRRLARPALPATPQELSLVIDPQPNMGDPEDVLLKAPLEALSRELFGFSPEVRTGAFGEEGDAKLTLCFAQCAFGPYFGKKPWKVSGDIAQLRTLCFVSAGLAVLGLPGEHGFEPSRRQAQLLRLFFSGPWLHGVRDAFTADLLRQAGVQNFVVVGTPSLWDVDDAKVAATPTRKGERVLFAADENYRDAKNDLICLRRLGEAYREIALWPRDEGIPADYAAKLVRAADIEGKATILAPTADALDAYLALDGTDYVGAELEVGIRALKAARRTLILTGDDRSIGVCRLCSLPSMPRYAVADSLREWLSGAHETALTIPREDIARWKAQFKR